MKRRQRVLLAAEIKSNSQKKKLTKVTEARTKKREMVEKRRIKEKDKIKTMHVCCGVFLGCLEQILGVATSNFVFSFCTDSVLRLGNNA